MKRPAVIIGGAVICAIAFIVYFAMRTPAGVAPMGDESSAAITWISLVVAVLTLMTTVVGLVQKLIELCAGKSVASPAAGRTTTASGERSVAVGGDAGGTIVTGDQNKVG